MSSKCKEISRREFLARSTQTTAGVFAATALASCARLQPTPIAKGRIIGANERVNMAVIGIRGRGKSLAKDFAKISSVRIKTLCDIDENLFPERVKKIEEIQSVAPSTEYDLRRVFDDRDIDAIAIATPNHWHALATIWACQAGKHVYVEKPCSHDIWEGRKMVEAARKYNCIVSVGFQNRSKPNVRQAMKFLHDGKLGEIYMARGLCFKPRDSFGIFPDSPVPEGVHYDLWLGPAPWRPFNEGRFHYNWHWHWDTGNGDIGNQGPHQFDIARWGMNKNEHPVKIRSFGGYFAFKDCSQETANSQVATYEYADGKILQFEVRGLYTNREKAIAEEAVADEGIRIGNFFFGTEGWMSLDGSTWKTYFGRENKPGPGSTTDEPAVDPMDLTGTGGGGHINNFIYALRTGKRENLTCDIEEGYMSTVLPHLANISYRLGRDLTFDGAKEKFVDDKEANRMLTGFPQVEDGRLITVRKYHKPYVVPKRV